MTEPGVDQPGVPIAAERFRALAAEYLTAIRSGAELGAEDYIAMVRLWNTIELGGLGRQDPLFAEYASAFFPAQVQRATDVLGANPTKGMALHSKQYDIYIGGKPHANSQYRIAEPEA